MTLVGPTRIWVVRHGDRLDFEIGKDKWEAVAQRLHDPVLSDLGHIQAQETASAIHAADPTVTRVISSPFLRCIQTSNPIAGKFGCKLCIDDSLFEVVYTTELFPPLHERAHYFPRIDLDYISEPRPAADEAFPSAAMVRYGEAAFALAEKNADQNSIVLCTHAAGVSAIVAALCVLKIRDLKPVHPASLFCLELVPGGDTYSLVENFSGSIEHFSTPQGKTLPWPRDDSTDDWGLKWLDCGDSAQWLGERERKKGENVKSGCSFSGSL